MIYIVFSKREEVMMQRIGVKEIQQYAHLRDFLPLLRQRGTVVLVRDAQREVKPIHKFLDYLGQDCLYVFFSPPDGPYSKMACPKMFIAPIDKNEAHPLSVEGLRGSLAGITFGQESLEELQQQASKGLLLKSIPPPVWDEFQVLFNKDFLNQTNDRLFHTNGNIVDTNIASLQPDHIGFTIPLTRWLSSIFRAFRYYKTDIHGLRRSVGRRRRDRFHATTIKLSGIIYTTVINPKRQHKNWETLILAFCRAFEKEEKTTLIIKMVGVISHKTKKAATSLVQRLSVRCRIILIFSHLSEDQYKALIRSTTYIINASSTKVVGSSLFEFMSAGKPAISPALGSLSPLTQENGFLTDSSTSGLTAQLRESYHLAQNKPYQYQRMSENATNALKSHCSMASVEPRFHAVMDAVEAKLR